MLVTRNPLHTLEILELGSQSRCGAEQTCTIKSGDRRSAKKPPFHSLQELRRVSRVGLWDKRFLTRSGKVLQTSNLIHFGQLLARRHPRRVLVTTIHTTMHMGSCSSITQILRRVSVPKARMRNAVPLESSLHMLFLFR